MTATRWTNGHGGLVCPDCHACTTHRRAVRTHGAVGSYWRDFAWIDSQQPRLEFRVGAEILLLCGLKVKITGPRRIAHVLLETVVHERTATPWACRVLPCLRNSKRVRCCGNDLHSPWLIRHLRRRSSLSRTSAEFEVGFRSELVRQDRR